MRYYLVNNYELQNSALVTIERESNDPNELHMGKKDTQVVISAGLLVEMGKFGWIES